MYRKPERVHRLLVHTASVRRSIEFLGRLVFGTGYSAPQKWAWVVPVTAGPRSYSQAPLKSASPTATSTLLCGASATRTPAILGIRVANARRLNEG